MPVVEKSGLRHHKNFEYALTSEGVHVEITTLCNWLTKYSDVIAS